MQGLLKDTVLHRAGTVGRRTLASQTRRYHRDLLSQDHEVSKVFACADDLAAMTWTAFP